MDGHNIRLKIEYEGSAFHGWQAQSNATSVEAELREVLSTVLGSPCGPVQAAGRTDAGVHARGQVVSFFHPHVPDLKKLSLAVSSLMRGRLSIVKADEVPAAFHPRRSARARCYSYRLRPRFAPLVLDAGRAWRVSPSLNRELLKRSAEIFVGTHNFSAFRAANCKVRDPVKTMYESAWIDEPEGPCYLVVGSGFLKQMVRIMIGAMVEVALGKRTLDSVKLALESGGRGDLGITAPAHGLCLEWVRYDEPF